MLIVFHIRHQLVCANKKKIDFLVSNGPFHPRTLTLIALLVLGRKVLDGASRQKASRSSEVIESEREMSVRVVRSTISIARQLTLVRASKALSTGGSPRAENQAHRPGRCTRGMSCTRAFYYVVQYRTRMRAIILKCSAA